VLTDEFYVSEKVEKTFQFCDYPKDSAFTAVKRDALAIWPVTGQGFQNT